MPDIKTDTLMLKCLDPARAADMALLVREELKARDLALIVSVQQLPGLDPETTEAHLCSADEPSHPEQTMNLVGLSPEQSLVAILNMLEKAGLLSDQAGYSKREEEIVNNRLEELGYI